MYQGYPNLKHLIKDEEILTPSLPFSLVTFY